MTGVYITVSIVAALTAIICTALVAGNKVAVEKERTKQEALKAAQRAEEKKNK